MLEATTDVHQRLKTPPDALEVARRVISAEVFGLRLLADSLGPSFEQCVARLQAIPGRIILSGIGKSGHIARKVGATLASTGTPAQFVHPTDASHGDLGMITPEDAVIVLSKSGRTRELGDLIGYCLRFGVTLVAVTAEPDGLLGRAATIVLELPEAPEACAETRAPTTSSAMMLALGDALAVALLEARGFNASDFRNFHPAGALGGMLARVSDLMHTGDDLPLAGPDTRMSDALITMSEKRFGSVGVVDGQGRLVGIVTDGDLRRHMDGDLIHRRVSEIMTADPKTIRPSTRAAEALRLMTAEEPRVTVLFALDDEGRPAGILHVHDCLRAGIT
ncbi:MAG: KpsF/GutQ family sugar-phosphate isomerase [Hyphomicrobiales bacterium]